MSDLVDFWWEWFPSLLDGLRLSVAVTAVSLALGIPLGLILALGVQSKTVAWRTLALFLVEIGRGAPALILLQFTYFGLPNAGVALSSFVSASLALAWCTGAYTSEIIRAGTRGCPLRPKGSRDRYWPESLGRIALRDRSSSSPGVRSASFRLLNPNAASIIPLLRDRSAGTGEPSLHHRLQHLPLHVDLAFDSAVLCGDLHSCHYRRFRTRAPAWTTCGLNFVFPAEGERKDCATEGGNNDA